jgi:CheY-like chemotaxis protein
VLIESLLTTWGYIHKVCRNGKDALEMLKKEKFDLILLDLMMKDMDGYEFLKHREKLKDKTPVVVISSLNEEENITKAMALGAIDYITKPFNSVMLKEKLPQYIEYRSK